MTPGRKLKTCMKLVAISARWNLQNLQKPFRVFHFDQAAQKRFRWSLARLFSGWMTDSWSEHVRTPFRIVLSCKVMVERSAGDQSKVFRQKIKNCVGSNGFEDILIFSKAQVQTRARHTTLLEKKQSHYMSLP